MVEEIYKRIWELSPLVEEYNAYLELTHLTARLSQLYDEQGRLNDDPFSPTRNRTLSLPRENINTQLKGSTCMVTGGLGCVGSILVNELLKFDVKTVIILDINKDDKTFSPTPKVLNLYCDIRSLERVQEIFALHQPNFIFHTAAIRNPGFSETHIEQAVRTNVLGTLNVAMACEATPSVKQIVMASTGKASRYFTEEVYAASKKIGEFMADVIARKSRIKYSMVRFTHILDNSLMNTELQERSANENYVAIHSPGKFVIAQNATEASYLMLNALVYSEEKQCRFLTVKHLEWPVESLEMALYHIKQSGRSVPVIFRGCPIGYSEKFFRGQMDWSKPNDLNLLINVYEQKHRKLNLSNDIIISRISPPNANILKAVLDRIENAKGEKETRSVLLEGLKEIVKETFKKEDKEKTINILQWGLDPRFLETEHLEVSDFGPIVPILIESLEGSSYHRHAEDLLYQIDLKQIA